MAAASNLASGNLLAAITVTADRSENWSASLASGATGPTTVATAAVDCTNWSVTTGQFQIGRASATDADYFGVASACRRS